MKKIISYILLMSFCLQIFPMEVLATPAVKSIDVEFNDLKLAINKNNFSHKKVFSYNNEIYIPMSDLGKALNLNVKMDNSKRTMTLSSGGRLKLDDTSPAFVAYQQGYEIESKKRIIKNIEDLIEDKVKKNTKSKDKNTIQVGFGSIEINLDSKKLNLYPEPLLYNNDIYVELFSMCNSLLITPNIINNIINFDTNAILKKENPKVTPEILVSQRNIENSRLTKRLEELNKKKKIMMDLKLPYMLVTTTSEMETYLNRYFDRIEIDKDKYVQFNIDLRKNSNNSYYLDINLENRYGYNWYELGKSQVQSHIWDLYVAITNLLDEDATVQGAIRNNRYSNRREYISFDTRYKDLNFNFTDSGLDLREKVDVNYIKDLLYRNRHLIYRYNKFEFDARLSGYDLEIIIEDMDGLYFHKWNLRDKTDFLASIQRIIHRQYPDLKISGEIRYRDQSSTFELDKDIKSNDLIFELSSILNKYYSTTKEGKRINMKYTLTQVEDEIKLMAYADISKTDSSWSEEINSAINELVDRALREVISTFDRDVIVKIFDKDGILIDDYGVFQNTVASVRANPNGGEVLSSQKVELLTDTKNATIYYTTDNTNPTINSTKYTESFTLGEDKVIKAFAIAPNMKNSTISTFIFKVVSDDNMSKGLDGLKVKPDVLTPNFSRLTKNYTMNIGSNISEIELEPIAETGIIKIDGVEIKSGEVKIINIPQNRKEIKITQKEENKSEISYTITVNKSTTISDIRLEVDSFITSIVGSFKGYLRSNNVEDFQGYTVVLETKSKQPVGTGRVDGDGNFAISFNINIINNLIGYRYKVIDSNGNTVDQGDLR